uniref:Protein SDA1 n=1 Tax=Echinococcus granulosus TaxID=6210 RepID=A0A068WCL3_ECHGR|nr:protein sda1 [Echinococcus granulosus]
MSATLIQSNLDELEGNIRRDPESYLPDFEIQYENYSSLEATYLSAPSEYIPKLHSLLVFLSQVIHLFPNYAPKFSENVTSALLSRSFGMNARMRMAYLKAFIRLRLRNFITLQQSVDVAFRLHRCQDKPVRKMLRGFVISDIKRTNLKNRPEKSNSVIQSFLASSIKDGNTTVAKEAVVVLVELYRRDVWKNEKSVNLIADACFAKSKKVYSKAVRFFLGHNEKSTEQGSSSDSDANVGLDTKIKQLKLGHRVGTKSKKRAKRLDRDIDNLKRKSERKLKKQKPMGINVPALNMIYDPQTFTEKLFHKLEKCNDRLEIRLLLLELISHLIGVHQLLLLNFYPSLQRFLRPQQREITRLLLFAAEASHDQVPPDAILPLVRTITDNFVTDRASAEAITVGLNTIREICARCPYAVDEDLLSDLVGYKSYRNKNVVAAARSLIRLYRRVNPSLLPKREVGRPTEAVKEALSVDNADTDALAASNGPARVFGKKCVATSIVGAEVLIEAVTSDTGDGERPRKRRRVERNLERVLESADDVGDEGGTRREGLGPNTEIGENSISKCPSDDDADSISTVEEEGGRDVEAGGDEDLEERKGATNKASNAEENKLVRTKPAKNVAHEEILATRVLTDEDFEAIRKRQAEKQTLFAAAGGRKRKRGEEVVIEEELFGGYADDSDDADSDKEVNPEEVHGLVSMRNITKLVKRPHSTKADRMDTVAEGREGRKKYGFQVNRMNPHASTTNREKRKKKTFQMIKHKVRRKAKRSFREKQASLREHLLKLSKNFRH